jgi:hypothetical protein
MNKANAGLHPGKNLRYTRSALFEIYLRNQVPFDLSKFSFAAVQGMKDTVQTMAQLLLLFIPQFSEKTG